MSGLTAEEPPSVESVFFRLHMRLVQFTRQSFSPRALQLVESLAFFNAAMVLMLLLWTHYRFVTLADQGCLTEALRRELVPFLADGPVHVVKLHLSGIWSHLQNEDATAAANLVRLQESEHAIVSPKLLNVWLQGEILLLLVDMYTLVQQTHPRLVLPLLCPLARITKTDPTFVYSAERGFLMLDEATRRQLGVRQANIRLRTEAYCFADSLGLWERYLLDNFVGYDTVVLNIFGAVFHGQVFAIGGPSFFWLWCPGETQKINMTNSEGLGDFGGRG